MWDSDNETTYDLQCPRKTFGSCDSDQEVDKENHSPTKAHDESLYETNSPSRISLSCNSSHRQVNRLRSLDEHDPSSQDSGYAASYQEETVKFHSFESLEDDFFEDFSDIESLEKTSNLPVDFNKLVNNTLKSRQCKENKVESPCDSTLRPMFRRALSLQNTSSTTPTNTKVRTSLFNKSPHTTVRAFKRPEPPTTCDNSLIKRSKLYLSNSPASTPSGKSPIKRSQSATEESIMHAMQRSTTEPDLIGDYSKNFCLPLAKGKHHDLKAISAETLIKLVNGEFDDTVASFKVIDCRYPYEFEGGHIQGAINIYTRTQCQELLQEHQIPATDSSKRHILVFHCEFSSERGPNLCRYLRQEDRHKNVDTYPLLHYPELYVLEGGYKKFFQTYSEFCVPVAYKQMLDPKHEDDLKHFRQKSKTWNADTKRRGRY